MNFRTALTKAKPLYVDGTMRVNFTVDELCQFVEDYLKDNQPILTVEVHEPKCGKCEMLGDLAPCDECFYNKSNKYKIV